MKPIGMPADRLTPDCIWSSFRSSGKRHLILTGSRGSGKSTLLKQLFPQPLPGLTTWAEPRKAVYLRDNRTAEAVQVGVFDETRPGPGNQMIPLPEGFAAVGAAALKRCMEADSPWVSIDEIGYLEAACDPYRGALYALLEKKQVAAVVRRQQLPFLRKLWDREDAFVVDLDDPFGPIGCVIMASGLGRRFGGNKLMADFHGAPMVCRILDATEGIFTRRVVVTRSEEVARLCRQRGIPTVVHSQPHRSDTVRLGLEAMPEIRRCMFAAADQPLLRPETVAALALAAKNGPACIWRTGCDGTPGNPVVFPGWTFPELMDLPEGQGGSAVIQKYPGQLRMTAVRDPYELMDADRPEDLARLLER